MKTAINQAIPRNSKALDTANVKHKCILPYKKVGWPVGYTTLKANHKFQAGEANFKEVFHAIDGTEDAKCCAIAMLWLQDLATCDTGENGKINGIKVG